MITNKRMNQRTITNGIKLQNDTQQNRETKGGFVFFVLITNLLNQQT